MESNEDMAIDPGKKSNMHSCCFNVRGSITKTLTELCWGTPKIFSYAAGNHV